jgi:hypothetical protein
MEDGILTFGVRAGTTDERELDKIDSVLSYSSSLRMAVRLVHQGCEVSQRQCSSRVSNYRDGQQVEEHDGSLALGPVGLGIFVAGVLLGER